MPSDHSLIPPAIATTMVTEILHRNANELAATLATLRIMKSRGRISHELLDDALIRVEAQAELQRLLLDRPADGTMREKLQTLCRLLLCSRISADKLKIALQAKDMPVPMPMRVPILLSAYEFINNAIKHAPVIGKPIRVSFVRASEKFRLTVSNRAFVQSEPGTCFTGLEIVTAISRAWGGATSVTSKNGWFSVRAEFVGVPAPDMSRYIRDEDDTLPF